MTPSQVLHAYRVASRNAKALGQSFVVSKTRLQGWGWTEDKIEALFKAIDRVDDLEDQFRILCASIDAKFSKTSG